MNYVLLRTGAFVRASKKLLRKSPELARDLEMALWQLQADPNHPSLKTHKLQGELRNSWACSAGYDLRIIFQFVTDAGRPSILLQTLGKHDEVY